ncbi:hypothetical protein NEOLEDRAFT_893519 [Neolentinus lepideus HHB14362 ss-1]|uniref:Uncharacterized protein n=1 Tax=Neolentinus lepideus HHB14362 ss-1 TaxID=1314782 RepID=A0A165NS27_9AGAM|nr:hypothetical protein NEOLEDRAFT_893519 [Neolentinus lepideus HHB14362 ss-1]
MRMKKNRISYRNLEKCEINTLATRQRTKNYPRERNIRALKASTGFATSVVYIKLIMGYTGYIYAIMNICSSNNNVIYDLSNNQTKVDLAM